MKKSPLTRYGRFLVQCWQAFAGQWEQWAASTREKLASLLDGRKERARPIRRRALPLALEALENRCVPIVSQPSFFFTELN